MKMATRYDVSFYRVLARTGMPDSAAIAGCGVAVSKPQTGLVSPMNIAKKEITAGYCGDRSS
ncbi:hypothetical protein CPter291_2142 [Collimonas pratensis]|uniref:Uncharacterized protein n=1 Tax=Collimonas pratensis TaxID=279113 RepID=A0ABM5Z5N2_9BURK|nr:hypothetical protein CPter291_2142 [Collimonas pratensis]